MIRPNELSAPGELAAYGRVEELFARLDEQSFDPMLPAPGVEDPPGDRDELLAEVEDLADRRGLGGLLDDARDQVEGTLLARIRGPGGYPLGVAITSGGRPEDEARLVVAIMDAVAVAVVQDVLDPATAEALAGPTWRLLGMEPLRTGASREVPDPADAVATEPDPAALGAPTARDWAEADHGATEIDAGEIPAGRRQARVVIAAVIALFAVPMAFVAAQDAGGTLLGAAAAVAVIAVCWTFATSGRR